MAPSWVMLSTFATSISSTKALPAAMLIICLRKVKVSGHSRFEGDDNDDDDDDDHEKRTIVSITMIRMIIMLIKIITTKII